MTLELTDRQLEDLESLTKTPGWKILDVYLDYLKERILLENSNAKNRDLLQKEVIIHETALETIRENNGKVQGVKDLIKFIESARVIRLKRKEQSARSK